MACFCVAAWSISTGQMHAYDNSAPSPIWFGALLFVSLSIGVGVIFERVLLCLILCVICFLLMILRSRGLV